MDVNSLKQFPHQEQHQYRGYRVYLYPIEQTFRDDRVWSYRYVIRDEHDWNCDTRLFDCDEIFWSGLADGENTSKRVLEYCIRWVDRYLEISAN